MKFLYPLGLLGLIGIPILIIIYIIKNKYTEQTVASTYLWELSEKFLKRKKKVNPVAGLISLLLQILAVTAISFAIAGPIVVLPNQAKEFCYVIDASASMNMEKGGVSRLDRAKDYVEGSIRGAVDGSVFSVVTVSDVTTIVYERNYDRDDALENLAAVQAGYVETDESDAIKLVQSYFTSNPGVKVVFVTDRDYAETENIEVINVADGEKNVAVSPLEAELTGETLSVKGSISSYEYGSAVTAEVSLYLDDSSTPLETQTVTVPAPVAATDGAEGVQPTAEFFFTGDVGYYDRVRVTVSGVEDNYAADNESILFNIERVNAYDVLVVSEAPFLISSAIKAVGNAEVDVITPSEYIGQRGYGLYVFDGFAPESAPEDGAVWFINVKGNVRGTGFSFQGVETLGEGETLSLATASSALAERLTADMTMESVYVAGYIRYGRSRHFTPLINYKNNPVVFTGVTDADNREVVFAFDIHETDFPLHTDFTVLVRNLLSYSFPPVLEEVFYYSGDTMEVNLTAGTGAVRVEAPSGNHVYLSTAGAIAEYRLDEVGVHKITLMSEDLSSQRDYYVYAGVPEAERNPYTQAAYVGLQGEATDGGLDGNYDPLWIVFAFLALVFMADWAVYCYEKYQLR